MQRSFFLKMSAALIGTTALPIIPAAAKPLEYGWKKTDCVWSPIQFTEWRPAVNAAAFGCYATCDCETHGILENPVISQGQRALGAFGYFVPLMITYADLEANADDPDVFKHLVESQQWFAAASLEDVRKDGCRMAQAIKQVYS